MLTLSDQDLDQLKCSMCHRLLSLFPIYSTKNADNQLLSICGRCQLPNDNNIRQYLRDEIYENLAKMLIFPCINQQYGCMVGLYPDNVKQHEIECCYQQQCCIFSNNKSNGCNWRGALKLLLKHYKEQHSDLILLENNKFEINIKKDDEIVNILPYKDEIFLFKYRYNCTLKRLKCYLGAGNNTVCEDYYILMHLNGDNWTLNYKFPESNFNIKIPLLDVKINGVSNPTGVVKICAARNMTFDSCRNKTPIIGGDTQNSTFLQCKYGCLYITDSDDLEIHYYICDYRTFDCFSDRTTICSWQGRRKDLSEHIFNHHKDTINNVNETLTFNIKRNMIDQYYINDNGSLYHLKVYNNRKRFDWKIEQINEAIKFDKIMCELCVVDGSNTKRLLVGKLLQATIKTGQLIRLCKGVTFALSKEQIKSYTTGNHLHFHINFTKIKT